MITIETINIDTVLETINIIYDWTGNANSYND